VQRHQGNVILRVVDSSDDTADAGGDEEAMGVDEADDDERKSDYSAWAEDNGDEEVDDDAETDGESQEPLGNDASAAVANNTSTLEVSAVQALFGPFFSSLVGHSFELIYVPHELCPDQGTCVFSSHFAHSVHVDRSLLQHHACGDGSCTEFHINVSDSYGRVVLVPRGGCNFADKAKELHKFNVAGTPSRSPRRMCVD
jgi:hypothetical protein